MYLSEPSLLPLPEGPLFRKDKQIKKTNSRSSITQEPEVCKIPLPPPPPPTYKKQAKPVLKLKTQL